MELLKEQLQFTETKFKDKDVAYVDGDVIVPDVKPDILKVLQVDAVSIITSKELSDGRFKVSGMIKYNILYIPEREGENIKSIMTEMPFSHSVEKKNLSEDVLIDINTDIERVEFTLLNSRKSNIKTAVTVCYKVWEKRDISVASGIDFEKAEIIYDKMNTRNLNVLDEHSFVIRDRLTIPSGRASIAEILKMDINICDREIKAITGKAVEKGNVLVCVLYIDSNGELNTVDGEIPFTEVAEIFELEEDAPCNVEYRVGDFEYNCGMDEDGEARTVDFDIKINSLVTSYEEKEMQIMKDCFCPGCKTDMIYDNVNIENIVSVRKNQYTIKEIIVPDKKVPQISNVYNVLTRPFIIKTTVREGKITVEGKVEVYILYITDNSQIPVYSFKKEVPVEFIIDNEKAVEGMNCFAEIATEHITFNVNMASEVELRCNLSVETKLSIKNEIDIISDCTLCEGEKDSGIIIYYVQPGDTLWQIAKRYCVALDDIVRFNNIQDKDVIGEGERLIIPIH